MIELNFPNAVREEKDFYGRRAELERIEQALLSGTRRPVAIYGERRIGKTSIINVVASRLRARTAPRIVPLFPATVGVYSLEDFARELLQSLCEFRGTSLTERGLMGSDRRFYLASMGQFFDETRKLLQGSPATLHVVFIDEFDALLHNCLTYGQAVETKKVLDLSSDLISQVDLPLTFLLTLTRLPDVLQNSINTSLEEEAERVDLYPLSATETDELLEGILGDQVIFEDSQQQRLYHLSGGHPYILKLLLSSLINHVPADAFPLRVDPPTLEQAATAAALDAHAEHVLGNILRVHFGKEERELVTLMAGLDDTITLNQLNRAGTEWRTAAENLARRGYLARENTGDSYVFRFTFLGHWLRQQPAFEGDLERLTGLRQRLIIEIEIDAERRRVLARGAEIQLTVQEYKVLSYLCQHVDRVVTRDQLADHLWPGASDDVNNDAAISATISRLRNKLGDSAHRPRYLETITGHGFILRRAAFT